MLAISYNSHTRPRSAVYMLRLTLVSVLIALCSTFVVAAQKIRVTAVGDSITAGRSSCSEGSYVNVLQAMLGKDYEVVNAGKSSMTMLKHGLCNDLTPCSYWDTDEWQTALSSKPDIVTIMLGTNDAKYFNWEGIQQDTGDYYALDYVDMVKSLRRLSPSPRVYLMIPPPLYDPFPFDMNATIINTIYPSLIRDIADVVDAPIIDIFSAFMTSNTHKNLTCDGCHPVPLGNAIIAQTIYDVITTMN